MYEKRSLCLAAIAFLCLGELRAEAAKTYWQVAEGDWFDTANWTAGVPTSSDDAYLTNGGQIDINCGSAAASQLFLADGTNGRLAQQGGDLSVQGYAYIARGVNVRGTYVLSTGSLATAGTVLGIGGYGAVPAVGRLEQYGGLHTTNLLCLGSANGNQGQYVLAGGELHTGSTYAGQDGNALFIQTGGVHRVSDKLWIDAGTNHYGKGEYQLIDGELYTKTTKLYVYSAKAEFVQSGGTHVASTDVQNSGTYYMKGGQLSTPTLSLYAGGKMIQSGGTVSAGALTAGDNFFGGSTNIYELQAGTLLVDDLLVPIGSYSCTRKFVQSGGALQVNRTINVGSRAIDSFQVSGGSVRAGKLAVTQGDTFEVIGAAAQVALGEYVQDQTGHMLTTIGSQGVSLVEVSGTATLAGTWTVGESGAPFGRFDVMHADGGISGTFPTVVVPNTSWSWGIDGHALWVQHVPEPSALALLGIGALALLAYTWRQRKRGV